MTVLLDTSVLIDVLCGHSPAVDFLGSLAAVPTSSEVTRIEVVRGLRSEERRGAERLFAALDWAPLDEPIARRAGELGRRYRRSYASLSLADLAIGATALKLGLDLATCNVRHFPMFKGLRPPYVC